MSRSAEVVSTGFEKPASKYLEWSSDEKCFKFWNKSTSSNEFIQLPLRLVLLRDCNVIKGWNDKSQSGIYSNEVKMLRKDILEVKSFKGGLIAKGLYNDIKDAVQSAGGRYHKSLYFANAETGEVINITIKGASANAWIDFMKEIGSKWLSNEICINDFKEDKKGRVSFSTPVFSIGSTIADPKKFDAIYDDFVKKIDKAHFVDEQEQEELEDEFNEISDDDLGF